MSRFQRFPIHLLVAGMLMLPALAGAENKSQSEPSTVYYTVSEDDNIGSIALRFGVGVREVRSWNKLEGFDVEPGTRLIVKSKEKAKVRRKDPLPTIHVVRRGDTFESIAKKHRVTVKKVKRWNRRVNPRRLQIGQRLKLYIPGRDGRSVSSGTANRGRLYNGIPMETVPGMRVRNKARAYGTERVIQLLESAAVDVKSRWPDAPALEVGDISRKGGGKLRPHRSHQSGRDADISYYHRGNVETGFRDVDAETFDAEKNWHVFKTLIDTGEVEYIFVDYKLQKRLYEYALHLGYTEEELKPIMQYPSGRKASVGIIRHSRGHDDHWHIRFKCVSTDKHCR